MFMTLIDRIAIHLNLPIIILLLWARDRCDYPNNKLIYRSICEHQWIELIQAEKKNHGSIETK